MSNASLPRHRDMPVSYQAGGGLFCTSFNSTDSGTKVYKNPYPSITKGALIDSGANPDYLVLPTPDFKVRNNYWVDSQEKNAISWGYVEVVISSTHYKYGKLAIRGIETSTADWGLYKEPMCCALISGTQLVVIYIDKVDYAGSGSTRYCAVYDYTLDFTNQKITVTESSSFNLTAAGYGTGVIGTITESGDNYDYNRVLLGFLGDAKTVIYFEYYNNQAFGTDFQQIKAFKLADDYLTVLSGDTLIYDPTYHRWDTTSTSGSSGGVSWSRDISTFEIPVRLVEIRGDNISFVLETDSGESYIESKYTPIVDGDYFPIQTGNTVRTYDLYKWDYDNGLSSTTFKTSAHDLTSTEVADEDLWQITKTYHSENENITAFIIPFIVSDIIYSDITVIDDYVKINGSYDSLSTSRTGEIISTKAGVIVDLTNAAATLIEWSYTKGAAVGSIVGAYDDSTPLIKSFVLDYKSNTKEVFDGQLTNISVTKL